MSSKSKKDSFIIQGSILAMAGILVRVIGLIYGYVSISVSFYLLAASN